MKFGLKLLKKMVSDWRGTYIPYHLFKRILKPYKIISNTYSSLMEKHGPEFVTPEEKQNDASFLQKFEEAFRSHIYAELEKINNFFNLRFLELLRDYQLLKLNLVLYEKQLKYIKKERSGIRILSGQKIAVNIDADQLRHSVSHFFRTVNILIDYGEMNMEGFRKIIKKHRKLTANFVKDFHIEPIELDETLTNILIKTNLPKLLQIKEEVKNLFLTFFYSEKKNQGHKELKKLTQTKIIPEREGYLLSYFGGFVLIFFILIIVLSLYGELDPDHYFVFAEVFPLFRGVSLLTILLWLTSWNVYLWQRHQVNYQKILGFDYHYSPSVNIMILASVLSGTVFGMFLWYILSAEKIGHLGFYLDFLPREYTAVLMWIILLGYLFFPSRNMLNGRGRLFILRILKQVALFLIYPITFSMLFAAEQLLSLVTFFSDTIYTLCFYAHYWGNQGSSLSHCVNQIKYTGFSVSLIFVCFLIGMVAKAAKAEPSGSVARSYQLFHLGKYISALFVILLSFSIEILPTFSLGIFQVWCALALFTAAYSSLWDVYNDWSFMQKNSENSFLRDKLIFPGKFWYYFALFSSFPLRLCWVCSLSQNIMIFSGKYHVLSFTFAVGEVLRRAVWNLITLERKHLSISLSFTTNTRISFPFTTVGMIPINRIALQKDIKKIDKKYKIFCLQELEEEFFRKYSNVDEKSLYGEKYSKKDASRFSLSEVEEKRSDISNSNILGGFESEREYTKSKSLKPQNGTETGFFFCDVIHSDFYNYLIREIIDKEKITKNHKEIYQQVKEFEIFVRKKYDEGKRVKPFQMEDEEERSAAELRLSLLKK